MKIMAITIRTEYPGGYRTDDARYLTGSVDILQAGETYAKAYDLTPSVLSEILGVLQDKTSEIVGSQPMVTSADLAVEPPPTAVA